MFRWFWSVLVLSFYFVLVRWVGCLSKGRGANILMMTNEKGRCDISDNAPKVDQTPEADPININFVGLEPQLRDDVHLA